MPSHSRVLLRQPKHGSPERRERRMRRVIALILVATACQGKGAILPGHATDALIGDCSNLDCGCIGSPIIFDVVGDGWALTDPAGGVWFDLDFNNSPDKLAWTAPGSDDAFLVLDRNGDGIINDGSELFGNYTSQPPSS